jgi:hypothetical protein
MLGEDSMYKPHMDTTAEPTTAFPVARCATCNRDALFHVDLDDDERQIIRCVECATVADESAVRWLTLSELAEFGYGLVLPEGGCGRPDCGGGRCGRSAPEDEA